ncbi:hypothetical protein DOY81_010357, partial [Sarcophaga bullata]
HAIIYVLKFSPIFFLVFLCVITQQDFNSYNLALCLTPIASRTPQSSKCLNSKSKYSSRCLTKWPVCWECFQHLKVTLMLALSQFSRTA